MTPTLDHCHERDRRRDPGRRGKPRARVARAWIAVLAGLLLAGCVNSPNNIRLDTGDRGDAYVPDTIGDALRRVGYKQVRFKSFKTYGEWVRVLQLDGEIEMRFTRGEDPLYIAIVNHDQRRKRSWVKLTENGENALSAAGARELEVIRASLRESFGESVVP